MILYQAYESSIGCLLLCADEKGLMRIFFEHEWRNDSQTDIDEGELIALDPTHEEVRAQNTLDKTSRWLDEYFSGHDPDFRPPMHLTGTDFQLSVWQKLLDIPFGETVSYGQIAKEIAKERGLFTMSAQAVGGAVGRNPIPIIIPCHRVIGKNGTLTGYRGGFGIKASLLMIEKPQW